MSHLKIFLPNPYFSASEFDNSEKIFKIEFFFSLLLDFLQNPW